MNPPITHAYTFVKLNGIFSIMFGVIGTFVGLLIILLATFPDTTGDSYSTIIAVAFMIICLLFWVVPHIFLILSGTILITHPTYSLTKGLLITNLVIGSFYNIILLVFSIISITQLRQYALEKKAAESIV